MITGISRDQRVEKTLKCDKGEEKTVFVLRPLTGLEMLEHSSMYDSNGKVDAGKVFQYIAAGVDSVRQPDGEKIEGKAVAAYIERLPIEAINELIVLCGGVNSPTEEDQKN